MGTRDPRIKKCSVSISYHSDDGYESDQVFHLYPIDHNVKMPEQPLIDGLEELARLTALFGLEAKAKEVFEAAQTRVREWKVKTGRATA